MSEYLQCREGSNCWFFVLYNNRLETFYKTTPCRNYFAQYTSRWSIVFNNIVWSKSPQDVFFNPTGRPWKEISIKSDFMKDIHKLVDMIMKTPQTQNE